MVRLENTTSHFETFFKALRYFLGYGYGNRLKEAVQAKVDRGDISIGAPKVFEGETLSVNKEGRYVVTKEVNLNANH